ncbi:unnamed protein product [Vicia faba]|uniref:Uncharacterized protein n=1 Tax=Vicia faba TaxID=3906 RepID=A0AAV0ZSU7_VICFA|nr:unnamed protein product [Vicia faba]
MRSTRSSGNYSQVEKQLRCSETFEEIDPEVAVSKRFGHLCKNERVFVDQVTDALKHFYDGSWEENQATTLTASLSFSPWISPSFNITSYFLRSFFISAKPLTSASFNKLHTFQYLSSINTVRHAIVRLLS